MDIVERLQGEQRIQQDEYGRGLEVLDDAADEIARLRDESARLRLEVDAWRERFKGYEYRRQDDVVALKLHDYGPGEPA